MNDFKDNRHTYGEFSFAIEVKDNPRTGGKVMKLDVYKEYPKPKRPVRL
ncbi:hypothetical protein [Marivirga sp.]|nr:hypothetical protein [Marivirga sp.]